MAQILTLKEKQPEAGKEAIVKKCIFAEASEAGTGRMWSFSIIYLIDDNLYINEYHKISPFLEVYQILNHEEIPDKEMSQERMKEILAPENIQIPEIKEKEIVMNDHPAHFNDSDIIRFITDNSNMQWNTVCSYVQEHGLISDCAESRYWNRVVIDQNESEDELTEWAEAEGTTLEGIKWMAKFFEANPTVSELYFSFR